MLSSHCGSRSVKQLAAELDMPSSSLPSWQGSELTSCGGPDLDIEVGVAALAGAFALPKDAPELCAAVSGGGDDPSVVDREGDGEGIFGEADEAVGSGADWEIPEAELAMW
ncbi:hypothetical protein U1Q18_040220 [Sarracenia purpurea var. burkii]